MSACLEGENRYRGLNLRPPEPRLTFKKDGNRLPPLWDIS